MSDWAVSATLTENGEAAAMGGAGGMPVFGISASDVCASSIDSRQPTLDDVLDSMGASGGGESVCSPRGKVVASLEVCRLRSCRILRATEA